MKIYKRLSWLISSLIIFLIVCLLNTGCRLENKFAKAEARAQESIQYGKSISVNNKIEKEAHAEGWNFSKQDIKTIETGNGSVPFISTVMVIFESPKDSNVIRMLEKTYIYDYEIDEWIPLAGDSWEFDNANNKARFFSSNRLWKGDYNNYYDKNR